MIHYNAYSKYLLQFDGYFSSYDPAGAALSAAGICEAGGALLAGVRPPLAKESTLKWKAMVCQDEQ